MDPQYNPPTTFAEFVARYPNHVRNWVKSVCRRRSAEDIEDIISCVHILMIRRNLVEKYEDRTKEWTNDPKIREKVFLSFLFTCVRHTTLSVVSRKPDPVDLRTDIHSIPGTGSHHSQGSHHSHAERNEESAFDSLTIDDAFAANESEEIKRGYREFRAYVAERKPKLLPALDAWLQGSDHERSKRPALRALFYKMHALGTPPLLRDRSQRKSKFYAKGTLLPLIEQCVVAGMTTVAAAEHLQITPDYLRNTYKKAKNQSYPVSGHSGRILFTPDGRKQCKCGETDLSQFSRNLHRSDGLQVYCRTCNKQDKRDRSFVGKGIGV